jgi:hypothetical protein
MRNRLITVILLVLILSLGAWVITLNKYNNQLLNQVEKRDSLLLDVRQKDSAFLKEVKQYSDTITKYISDCEFTISGKKIPTSKVVEWANEYFYLRDSISNLNKIDSIKNLMIQQYENRIQSYQSRGADSIEIFKYLLKKAENDYGINYTIIKTATGYEFEKKFSRADSASILFPYYKHKIRYDSTSKKWLITLDPKK